MEKGRWIRLVHRLRRRREEDYFGYGHVCAMYIHIALGHSRRNVVPSPLTFLSTLIATACSYTYLT